MNKSTIDKVNHLRRTKKGYLRFVMDHCHCDRAEAQVIADRCLSGEETVDEQAAGELSESGIVFNERYTYNPVLDQYIVPLKSYGGNYICKGEHHRGMQLSYSRYGNESINEICHTYQMDRAWFTEYKSIMGWTKTMLPISKEEVMGKDQKTNLKLLGARRLSKLQQAANRQDWNRVQVDARQWQEFQAGEIDPFESFLKKFQPTPLKPLKFTGALTNGKKKSKNTFLVGLSDLHFGGKADADELFNGEDFNAERIAQVVDSYAEQIAESVSERNYRFEKAVICVLGDILHSLSGRTEKGTQLEYDVLREAQFELAFESMIRFITRMVEIFGSAEVHCIKGNHAGPDDYILCLALKSFFRADERINFELYKSRAAIFRVNNIAILMDHGDSDYVKAKVPKDGAAREAYIQARFMEKSELIHGTKTRLMIQGDQHHCEYKEHRAFEYFMFSSPSQDRYADHLNLSSKPRQNCLILSEDGLKEFLHFYF